MNERIPGTLLAMLVAERMQEVAELIDQAKHKQDEIMFYGAIRLTDLHTMDIDTLNMSARATNTLKRAGVVTVEDALYCFHGNTSANTPFHDMKDVGDVTYDELARALDALQHKAQDN